MEYSICTDIKLKCPACNMIYNITVKDKKQINIFKVECTCGKEVTNKHEINEYGSIR